jgi:hypothetical protein
MFLSILFSFPLTSIIPILITYRKSDTHECIISFKKRCLSLSQYLCDLVLRNLKGVGGVLGFHTLGSRVSIVSNRRRRRGRNRFRFRNWLFSCLFTNLAKSIETPNLRFQFPTKASHIQVNKVDNSASSSSLLHERSDTRARCRQIFS